METIQIMKKKIIQYKKVLNAERIPCDPISLQFTKCLSKYLVKDKYIYPAELLPFLVTI